MIPFQTLVEAWPWCKHNAQGACTVVVHGDPYEFNPDNSWGFERKYPDSFYLRES